MTIFFLCNFLSIGGAERVCVDVANGLSLRGHKVTIITDLSTDIMYPPLPTVELINCNMTRFRYLLKNFWLLLKTFKQAKPDVVVSILYTRSLSAKFASLLTCGCPIVASDHNSFERPKGYDLRFVQKLDKFYFNYLYDYLTVLTKADLEFLNGRFKNKSCVMYNPLAFEPAKSLPKKKKVVLAVGRLSAWKVKGFDILLKAWGRIADYNKDWTLKIVGQGDEHNIGLLKSFSNVATNVEFKPFTKEIIAEYREAEVFVLSSRFEGFGLVLTEAMSQGCACVACDYKGRQAEIVINGENGLICEPENVDMLAYKIEYLITHEKERRHFQINAMKSLERFSIDNVVNEWENMLTRVARMP